MRIVIAGGHGQVAMRLSRLLSADGHDVVGLVRNPDHADEVSRAGAKPVVADLESTTADELSAKLAGADMVVFAAGAGPGSGTARKESVDRAAALLLLDAAVVAGVGTYVMLSAMGTDDPPGDDDVFSVYLRAKADADRAIQQSDLAWTIVRPGSLTDDPGTGLVHLARHVERGEVTRDDVAAVLAAVIARHETRGHIIEVVGGNDDIDAALDALDERGQPDR